ncbi:hypothetical protein CEK62_09260 [Alcanivorax sp. N3-2A]|nr:hypothetical protein CEK62_09260 [Alcanivorax sp. N3-2A]
MDFIQNAGDLREINAYLTKSMAQQKIQALIKGANLVLIRDAVTNLAINASKDRGQESLVAAAVLGRLSAVARGRQSEIFSRIAEILSRPPEALDMLADGDEKYYAALAFQHLRSSWTVEYCCHQAIYLDTAEKARRVMLDLVLIRSRSVSAFLKELTAKFDGLEDIDNDESRYKRIKRLSSAVHESVKLWDGEVGENPGNKLSEWAEKLFRSKRKNVEKELLSNILDDALGMLLRVIELRFSNALLAETYCLLDKARKILGWEVWSGVIKNSGNLGRVTTCLKESALVLARQGRTDKEMMEILRSAYYSSAQVRSAIFAHFSSAQELQPDVREWWESAGNVKSSLRKAEHRMGNTEDQQIGTLLINVEDSKTVMEKLERAVVPFLELSDPPLAETVKKAAASYVDIALATRQLATMRRLKKMGLRGEVLEYNPMQHEMLGGHKMGIRKIRVERDGIEKDFGGKIKILVKPRVVPEK